MLGDFCRETKREILMQSALSRVLFILCSEYNNTHIHNTYTTYKCACALDSLFAVVAITLKSLSQHSLDS